MRGGNIINNSWELKDDDLFIEKKLVKENILLRKNDIISPAVTSIDNIGKMARIENNLINVTAGGFVFIMRPYLSIDILSSFLIISLSNPSIINAIKNITKKSGSAFYNIGKERLLNIPIPIAPINEQHRICNRIKELFDLSSL